MNTGLETREDLFAVMEQIAEEREAARPIVRELVARGRSIDDIEIPQGWRTAGMVLEIAEHANSRLENWPLESLAFAHLALSVATISSEYPLTVLCHTQGFAFKEIGYANRYLNNYEASIQAYKSAEKAFSRDCSGVYQETMARFARAIVEWLARVDEALELTASVRPVLVEFGDEKALSKCDVIKAYDDYRRGDFQNARLAFEAALQALAGSDDLHTIGLLYNALGCACRYLGRNSEAVTAFERGREIFTELDMPSEINRAKWGLGTVLLDGNNPGKALLMLSPIREDFLSRHMPEEAGEVGLVMVDALLGIGNSEAAATLTGEVLREFVNAKLNTHAIIALAYLRDLLPKTQDPRAAVRRVRTYVEKLRSDPARLFVPFHEER